jgi:uncharacterized HhH-GPD family protein
MTAPPITIEKTEPIGAFTYRWPVGDDERYERGWSVLAHMGDREVRVRHGLCRRAAYGRDRARSVTWVELAPTVEGVEADDYAQTRGLVSGLRTGKAFLRPGDRVPDDYRDFPIVDHSVEIDAPRTRRILAVKLPEDDVESWSRLALLRAFALDRLGPQRMRPRLRPARGTSAPVDVQPDSPEEKRAVVNALLEYGATLDPELRGQLSQFTPIPKADRLVREDPFAFLVAVICDQGVPAERAWEAPYLLQQRLGHLDAERIAADGDALMAAFQRPPKLHRFVNNVPAWIVAAASRVMRTWDGDAGRIWNDRPNADVLQQRLVAFKGIAQKKAAMAVEILERDLGVEIGALDRSDVAVDIHLRRVFLRTHLAERDDRDHMIEAARHLHPRRPGELDYPVWMIGRKWCAAGIPRCLDCPLTRVCPKDIERAAAVSSG